MRMKCSKCGREMSGAEATGHLTVHLFKFTEKIVTEFITRAIEHYFANPPRGVFDDHFSGVASKAKLQCPNCQSIGQWKPAPEIKSKKKQSKTINP
jgi:hypothetical protein